MSTAPIRTAEDTQTPVTFSTQCVMNSYGLGQASFRTTSEGLTVTFTLPSKLASTRETIQSPFRRPIVSPTDGASGPR